MFFLACAILCSEYCATDEDCRSINRPDVHSLFCVDNVCKKLVGPGSHCSKPSDCASYFYYGPLACTAKCKNTLECGVGSIDNAGSLYCCKAVPEKGECDASRPKLFSGCDLAKSCTLKEDGYKCSSPNEGYWFYTLLLSVLGNLMINLGVNLQKLGFSRRLIKFGVLEAPTYKCGIVFYVLGKVSSFSAYIFGNQSLIASLSGIGLVSNSILAPVLNDENFTWKDLVAIVLIMIGSSNIIKNMGNSGSALSFCELLQLYRRKETLSYFFVIGTLLLVIFLGAKFLEINSEWLLPDEDLNFLNFGYNFEETMYFRSVMVLSFLLLSSIVASVSGLFAKSLGEMINLSMNGDNQFFTGTIYLFFTLLVFATFLQLHWLNRALRRFDALLVVPLFQIMYTIFANTTAGIYFQEFEYYTYSQYKGFLIGLLFIFSGSIFLTGRVLKKSVIETEAVEFTREMIRKKDKQH